MNLSSPNTASNSTGTAVHALQPEVGTTSWRCVVVTMLRNFLAMLQRHKSAVVAGVQPRVAVGANVFENINNSCKRPRLFALLAVKASSRLGGCGGGPPIWKGYCGMPTLAQAIYIYIYI